MNNYVTGRNREYARLAFLKREKRVILGVRFRGSKISKGWINYLGFNPKIDLWWIDTNHVSHFEQLKTAAAGYKARISKKEIESVQRFADLFSNSSMVRVVIVTKDFRQPYKERVLN